MLVNNKVAKPGLKLKIGDIIELTLGDKVVTFKVVNLNEYANKSIKELDIVIIPKKQFNKIKNKLNL